MARRCVTNKNHNSTFLLNRVIPPYLKSFIYEPFYEKSSLIAFATSVAQDQLVHPRSLIRGTLFARSILNASTGRPGLCLFSKPTYPLFKFVSPSVNCSFRKSIFTTNTFQGIQYFNSFSISVVLDFYIRSLSNGSERGHCASNTSARRDVTIDDVIIRTPDVMCEWLTRRTRYIPNFICLACKLIAL